MQEKLISPEIRFAGKLIESEGRYLMHDETDMGCDVDTTDVEETKCFLSGKNFLLITLFK